HAARRSRWKRCGMIVRKGKAGRSGTWCPWAWPAPPEVIRFVGTITVLTFRPPGLEDAGGRFYARSDPGLGECPPRLLVLALGRCLGSGGGLAGLAGEGAEIPQHGRGGGASPGRRLHALQAHPFAAGG